MRVLNLLLVVATLFVVGGSYLQEKKRLGTIRELPAPEARALFESTQKRRDRVMLVVTTVLLAAAVTAVAALLIRARA